MKVGVNDIVRQAKISTLIIIAIRPDFRGKQYNLHVATQ